MQAATRRTVSRHALLSGTAIAAATIVVSIAATPAAAAAPGGCPALASPFGTNTAVSGTFAGFGGTEAAATNYGVYAGPGPVTINGAGLYAHGTGGGAINVGAYGNATIAVSGSYGINGTASGGAGALCVSTTSTVTISSPTVAGINAVNTGTGSTTVNNSGAITATGAASAQGIHVSGAGTVVINNGGAIVSSGDGIFAQGTGSAAGAVQVNAGGTIDAHGAYGVYATTAEGGGLGVNLTGTISGNATNGVGLNETSTSGSVTASINGTVGSSGAHVSGKGVYVEISNAGSNGQVVINGTGHVYGTSDGLLGVSSSSGGVHIDFSGNATGSGHNAITGFESGTGDVSVLSRGTTHGLDGAVVGIIVNSASSANAVAKNYGSAFAGYGVYANNQGHGQTVAANYGYVSATHRGVDAKGTSNGAVVAYNAGNGTIHMSGPGTTIGLYGLSTVSGTGTVTVTNKGSISGGTRGMSAIITNSSNHSTMYVRNTGYTYGTQVGEQARSSGNGSITIINSGTAKGGQIGIQFGSYNGGAVTVTNSHIVHGGSVAGVYGNTSATTLISNNSGGTIYANSGMAIETHGGPTTINNAAGGAIFGHVNITANSTINNAGLWDTYGTSNITTGNGVVNVLNNSGTLFDGETSATITLINGLTTVNNTGLVDLRNGHAGDQLWLGTGGFATWNGLAGSRLGLDANLSSALVSDQLVIGAATGSTTVLLNDTAPGAAPAVNFTGVRAVWPISGSGVFNMATYHKGFVDYELVQRAPVSWFLIGVPSSNAFELLKLPAAGWDFWRRTGDVWSAREQEVRDSNRQPGWQAWAQAFGGGQRDTRAFQTFSVGGMSFSPNLGTNNDWRGFQMGVDNLSTNKWLVGLTAGFTDQDTRFRGAQQVTGQGAPVVHDGFDLTGGNFGVYAGLWDRHGFFLNALAKADFFGVDLNMPSAGVRQDFQGSDWGVKGELGFRWGGQGFYVEPLADIDYVSTFLSDQTLAGATFQWSKAASSRGEVGARIGGQWGMDSFYVGAYAVDQFSGGTRMTTLFGGACPSCMTVTDVAPGSYGKVDLGWTFDCHGLQGFLKGEELFGDHVEGYAGRLGVRWRW